MKHDKDLIQLLYNECCDIWKNFCEYHNELYQLACQEYTLLLNSQIEDLEECIKIKEALIIKIGDEDSRRFHFIQSINSKFPETQIEKARDLIDFFETQIGDNLLSRYNNLLIDVIENIQVQNKRNKIFLNKALYSLNQLKRDFHGKPSVETYDKTGQRHSVVK
ncbi:MAG: flagellar protein FlgN [Halobacteriovoraceae bacterium]|nr:flagellar protein FlgN [Halobacteriovoraceae bacterium]